MHVHLFRNFRMGNILIESRWRNDDLSFSVLKCKKEGHLSPIVNEIS